MSCTTSFLQQFQWTPPPRPSRVALWRVSVSVGEEQEEQQPAPVKRSRDLLVCSGRCTLCAFVGGDVIDAISLGGLPSFIQMLMFGVEM